MSYQILKAGKTMKLDIEKALFDNNAKVAGSSLRRVSLLVRQHG